MKKEIKKERTADDPHPQTNGVSRQNNADLTRGLTPQTILHPVEHTTNHHAPVYASFLAQIEFSVFRICPKTRHARGGLVGRAIIQH